MASSSSPDYWNADDIRKNAAKWSLEGDSKLLGFMQSISQNLERRATITKTNLNRLTLNVEHTSIALDNAINKLAALQHSQFVENRVYDDDDQVITMNDTKSMVPTDTKNDTEKPYDPTSVLKTIITNSLTVLDECYEKVAFDIEDSDEDEPSKSIVYRPKNPFDERTLPYIIGSKEWKEKWHIGLCDSDEDYSDDEDNNEQYSESESDENISLSASIQSNAPTISESEISSTWGGLQRNILKSKSNQMKFMNSSDDDEEISSNTITTSRNSSEDSRNPKINTGVNTIGVPIPDQRYYTHKPRERNLFDESSSDDQNDNHNDDGNNLNTSTASKDKNIRQNLNQILKSNLNDNRNINNYNRISNIISDEPPPDDDLDEVDRDEQQRQKQQYSIENDTMGYHSTLSTPNLNKKNDMNENPLRNSEDKKLESITKVNTVKRDENRINNNSNSSNTRKKTVNLFDDDDFNSFMKELDKRNSEKLSVDTESVVKPKNLFDDDDVEDDDSIFKKSTSTIDNSAQVSKVKESQKIETPPSLLVKHQENRNKSGTEDVISITKAKILNLFDDELKDDDDFDTIFGSSKKQNENKEKLMNRNSNLLTSTPSDIESISKNNNNDIQNKGQYKNNISNLFSEEPPDDDDDIFKVNNSSKNIINDSKNNNKINIFSDDEDDLFSESFKRIKNNDEYINTKNDNNNISADSKKLFDSSLRESKNLFDVENNNVNMKDESRSNDKESNNHIQKTADIDKKLPTTTSTVANKLPNLFLSDNEEEENEDDDDIFNFSRKTSTKTINAQEIITTTTTTSTITLPVAAATTTVAASKINTNLSNLFFDNDKDDDDDDFLFGIKKQSNNQNSISNPVTTTSINASTTVPPPLLSSSSSSVGLNGNNQNYNIDADKNVINSKISTLMNLFSDDPPSDDEFLGKNDIIFDINAKLSSRKSITTTVNDDKIEENTYKTMQEEEIVNDEECSKLEKVEVPNINKRTSNNDAEESYHNQEIRNIEESGTSQKVSEEKGKEDTIENNSINNDNSNESNNIRKISLQNDETKVNNSNSESNSCNTEITNEGKVEEIVPIDKVTDLNDQITSTNRKLNEEIKEIHNDDNDNDDDDLFAKITQHQQNQKYKQEQDEREQSKNIKELISSTSTRTITTPVMNSNEEFMKTETDYYRPSNQNHKFSYDPIGLFQDIPPEDDFQFSINDQKQQDQQHNRGHQQQQQHQQQRNIFYDDFSETIPVIPTITKTSTTATSSSSSSYNVFNNEPPPDDIFDQVIEERIITENTSKRQSVAELTRNINDAVSTSISPSSSSTSTSGTKSLDSVKSSSKSEPRKLNSNLLMNINVAALLPGAKRPSIPSSSNSNNNNSTTIAGVVDENKNSNNEEILDSTIKTSSSIATNTVDATTDHNILTSLNKNRAKIMVTRRPSTRKGRQESYRKSLIQEKNDTVTIEPDNDDNVVEDVKSSSVFENSTRSNSTSNRGIKTDIKFDQKVTGKDVEKVNPPLLSNDNNKSNKEQLISAIKSIENLFNDNGDDDEDEIFSEKKKVSKNDETFVNNSNKENPSVDINQTKIKNLLTRNSNDTTIMSSSKSIKPLTELLSSNLQDDDDDDLFAQKQVITTIKKSEELTIKKTSTAVNPNPTAATTIKTKSIFLDDLNDDDDDDLFSTKSSNNIKSQNQIFIQEQKSSVSNTSGRSLLQSSVKAQSSKLTTIFSSDDDDDDLFGGGSGSLSAGKKVTISSTIKTPTVTIPKKTENYEKSKLHLSAKVTAASSSSSSKNTKSNSLFGDDELDDDDDLFGGKDHNNSNTKKGKEEISKNGANHSRNSDSLVKNRNVPAPKKAEKKTITTAQNISDNPLSDLLND